MENQSTGCIWCDGGIKQWTEVPGRMEHLITDPDHPTDERGNTICGNFVPCTRKD